ncbi:MAG TPA: WHG domain-containing protein [Nitrolancea sp.]|nr:WHG domain-containing protein [Nitrolancea sp.]
MPKRNLSRAAVIQAAAELLDECAGSELKLSDLAARLGVRVPSLYNHVDGADDLKAGVALYGLEELRDRLANAAIGRAGEDALLAIASAYRSFAKERPGLYTPTLRAPAPDDTARIAASDEIIMILRRVLEPFDLSDEDTIHVIRGLRSLLHGFVSLELAGGFGIPLDVDESFHRLIRVYLDGLRDESADLTPIGGREHGDVTRG